MQILNKNIKLILKTALSKMRDSYFQEDELIAKVIKSFQK